MNRAIIALAIVVLISLLAMSLSAQIVKHLEQGVLFRLGRIADAVKAVIAIESVDQTINQIAQTTLSKFVGRHSLDETLSETDRMKRAVARQAEAEREKRTEIINAEVIGLQYDWSAISGTNAGNSLDMR